MSKSVLFTSLFSFIAFTACSSGLPASSSEDYKGAVKSFYVGLAAMQVGDDVRARTELENASKLASGEPAVWVNFGILQMRHKDFESSVSSFEKARNLAPGNAKIFSNKAVLSIQRGNFEEAIANLEKAIALEPNNSKYYYALARERERQESDADSLALFEQVLSLKTENLPTMLEIVRLAAKRGDKDKLRLVFAKIVSRSSSWEGEIKTQFEELRKSVESGDMREIAKSTGFFRNVLLRLPEFRSAINEVRFDDTVVGEPFLKPLKLQVPELSNSPPDENLTFNQVSLSERQATWSKAIFLDGETPPVNAWASESEIRIGDKTLALAGSRDLQTIDIDYNFKNDFVIATDGGLRFFDDNYEEITGATQLSKDILSKKFVKIFTFDFEIDGDLDLILASEDGSAAAIKNNAGGTFKQVPLFSEIAQLREFASADLDEDGDMDAVFLNSQGRIDVLTNERGGQFRNRQTPVSKSVSAIAIADSNSDGKLDLNLLASDGSVIRVTDKNAGEDWETTELFRYKPNSDQTLILQDFDNSGSIDILISDQIWLGAVDGQFTRLTSSLNGKAFSSVDLNGDGKLDFAGKDADGKPARFLNLSEKNYAWQIFRPRSAKAEGDQRVNSFGIGGEMEIRSGLSLQKRLISSPQVHFGLGDQSATDLLRVVWGNGFVQAEFDLAKDHQILVAQRLTGSCPHLFAWNGTEFKLVKDVAPLGTSLGLKISENEVLPVTQTREWYKIESEQLAPKDGSYELRITDELWESYYVDSYSLLAVDHPIETEVIVNELYPVPDQLNLNTTRKTKPFAGAIDDTGAEVSEYINKLDEVHLDTFEHGQYQGVAKDHFVELELPKNAPKNTDLLLIAEGWLHPTDTSLNVAISQSGFEKPRGLSLEILYESGEWRVEKENFGVPAGKLKTVVIDLPKGTSRARLRTNMEIYWDKLSWTETIPEASNDVKLINLENAELRYRGFSVIDKKDDSSPELPVYNKISTTAQRWRPIEGYYTRFGDILELLSKTDDRYAIVNTGDEMILKFSALPAVRDGFKRDFVLVGDGWIKEGDYNNVFSKTVLPLPTKSTNDYTKLPTTLENDPVFRKNRADWLYFHTRYVAPDLFRNALRTR